MDTIVPTTYHGKGWPPLPLPPHKKSPPPEGRTGATGVDMTLDEIRAATWDGNIGVRMPVDVVGLDSDRYKPGGKETWDRLVAECGELPPTMVSHSGRNDGSGIRYFRAPAGTPWIKGLPGLDMIYNGYRYAVVAPSEHPDGRTYGWWDEQEQDRLGTPPLVEDLPELPWPWFLALSRATAGEAEVGSTSSRAAGLDEVASFINGCPDADAPSYLGNIVEHFVERRTLGYSRHDTMQHCLTWAMECARAGIMTATAALTELAAVWQAAVEGDHRRAELHSDCRVTEFDAMLRWAVGKVMDKTPEEMCKLHDDIAGVRFNVPPEPEPSTNGQHADVSHGIWLDWSAFANRDDAERRWLVEGFWPWGRAMALWAAAKTGKSELALWCAINLALGREPWTLAPCEPVDVAYFDYEMTEDDLDDRLAAFNVDPLTLDRLHYALLPALHSLDIEQGGAEVEHHVAEVGARAVVFDTFGRGVAGDENEADTVRAFYRHTGSRLKRMGVGYLRTDHAGKDMSKGQRGSSAKRDDVDVVWAMKRSKEGVLLDCTSSSRLSWVGPILQLDRAEVGGALIYTTPMRMGWPVAVLDKAAELDKLGLPLDVSRRAARQAMTDAGMVPGTNDVLGEALKYRNERASSGPAGRRTTLDDLYTEG
jgi:hypothetical protein